MPISHRDGRRQVGLFRRQPEYPPLLGGSLPDAVPYDADSVCQHVGTTYAARQ
jgi:hypothetical protein